MSSGILGMNARNLKYVRVYNKNRRVADEKLLTKALLRPAGVPVPKLYGVIRSVRDFEAFAWNKLPSTFAVKPNRGFGGEGILVLRNALPKQEFLSLPAETRVWLKMDGTEVTYDELRAHVLGILDGQFSLQEAPDVAFFERKLSMHKAFKSYVPSGVADIRVIVFNRVPVMAMMRVPTIRSGGRANIAQGAVGVGIDIGRGLTTTAMVKVPWRRIIDAHPDTGQELHGFAIPFWDDILTMSVLSQDASEIGYLGVDIVVDQQEGPVLLELNARPGLDIQVANQEGLARRLERVEGLKIATVEKGMRVAKELFGGATERLVEEVSGRDIIGSVEKVVLSRPDDETLEIDMLAKIDTGAYSTSISAALARKLGFGDVVDAFPWQKLEPSLLPEQADAIANRIAAGLKERLPLLARVVAIRSSNGLSVRPVVRILLSLSGKKFYAAANITERTGLAYEMIVGRRQLRRFLIDPARKVPSSSAPKGIFPKKALSAS